MIHVSSIQPAFAETAIYLPKNISNELIAKGKLHRKERSTTLLAGELRGRRRGSIVEIVELGHWMSQTQWAKWTDPQDRNVLDSSLDGKQEARLELVGAWLALDSANSAQTLPKVFPDHTSLILVVGEKLISWKRENSAWFKEVVTPGS